VLPNFTNIMSRDGAMERSTYLISLVLCFVIGFFMVSIIYINSTKETTTFMAKIVGLTLVSILLVVQAWGFYMAQEQDGEYNSLKIEKLFNVLDTGLAPKSVEYILRYPKGSEKIEFTRYPSITRLDLSLVEADFKNTIIFEDLQNLDVENYKEELLKYLQTTHPEFIGYKKSILNFVKEHPELKKQELKAELFSYLEGLNRATFIHANKISNFATEGFCKKLESFIKRSASSIKYFREPILQELKSCTWEESPENVALYRRNVYKHLRHFTPALSRHYRLSSHPYREQKHYIVFRFYDRFAQVLTEVGYSYTEYREEMHSVFKIQTFILLIAVIFITVFYPLFFKGSLLNPLRNLLQGVRKVNKGDLDLEIKVIFHDEIGFLSESFNSMVNSIRTARRELQDYAENLEEKVAERTREVEERMEEIKKLKVQQDGDYYLTSLLAKPLFLNANKSQSVKTEFLIYQKKQFEFRNRKADLGGDICVTGNVKLGNPDTEEFRRYTLAMNGDAMGKSMQGAGGSLVMGVVINSIMRRAADKGIIPNSPQEWLTKVYHEINGIFKAFNGTMVISCVIMLIDDETGEVFYFNAEHPFCVLYRNGDVRFIEKDMQLRKLGLDSEIEFQVYKYQLIPGDVIIMGSDGRDDIDMSPNEVIRTINEDTSLFLNHVRIGKGKLEQIKASILTTGSLIDDLSLLRLAFKESEVELGADEIELSNTDYIYEQCKLLLND
ncbi:MAG: SpoIIE family protein phosphatase, partial [Leptospiraceae bacterium]|nr:SpoIIE family protein phosphatase [Leptospiraceae bacterium]